MQPTVVLATFTGRDRPGVTASLFTALAAHDVEISDVEQIVIRERLVLAVLFDLRGDPSALRTSLMKTASALGMDGEVVVADEPGPERPDRANRVHVLVLGRLLRPGALAHVAQQVADQGANIESIGRAADPPDLALELFVRAPSPARLRAALVHAAKDIGVDVAVQPARQVRRAKRLVVLDVTSTLLPAGAEDPLGQLAERAGVGARLGAVRKRESAGELPCAEALRVKAELFAGLAEQEVRSVGDATPLRRDAREVVSALHRLGYAVGAVCSDVGFSPDRLRDELGLDFVAANQFEVRDGVLTGGLSEPVIDRAGKAAALAHFAGLHGVPLAQTVAVGAGVNDLDLLQTAGMALACTGASSRPDDYLDSVLFVLGAGVDAAEAVRANR